MKGLQMINEETSVAVHPCEFLKDSLELCGMTQKDLAKRTGRTEKTITAIMRGKDRISPESALKLDTMSIKNDWKKRRGLKKNKLKFSRRKNYFPSTMNL